MSLKVLTAICMLGAIAFASCSSGSKAAIEQRSERVMPFSISGSTHVFTPTKSGGIQEITVHDGDRQQISLVRHHLRQQATAFAHGDFSNPAYVHGDEMPGLNELQRSYARMSVVYADTYRGGRITYVSSSPTVVAAIHHWFQAQVRDHGAHAQMGGM